MSVYTNIYSLLDPITGEIKYIGKANNVNKRYTGHLCEKSNTKKNSWIKSLKKNKLKPLLEILDVVNISEWQFWEMHYISLYKSWGFHLVNGDNGGLGTTRLNSETKQQIGKRLRELGVYDRLSSRKIKRTPEQIEAMRIMSTGKKHSEETKKKMSESHKGLNTWSKGVKTGKRCYIHGLKISKALLNYNKFKKNNL